MIVFVSGATQEVLKYVASGHVGRMFVPRDGNSTIHARDMQWAADNGAFSGFDEASFLKMLLKLKGLPRCRFVAAPDVVANYEATSDLFGKWTGIIRGAGFPVAYVAQDGVRHQFVPWGQCDAVFIGGTTEFKLSDDAGGVASEAVRRRKWLHMGRVSTLRRIKRARSWNCDSIDGSAVSRFPGRMRQVVSWTKQQSGQLVMPIHCQKTYEEVTDDGA